MKKSIGVVDGPIIVPRARQGNNGQGLWCFGLSSALPSPILPVRCDWNRREGMPDYDVIVVGAGNAALAASVSAREHGAEKVLVLGKAPLEMRGGNTYWSGGLL